MITKLSLKNVGPAPTMEADFSSRLNIITGDNGLGKTFLLDAAWFALTRTWAGNSAILPLGRGSRDDPPQIKYTVVGKTGNPVDVTSDFDFDYQEWTGKQARPPMPGLVVYARIDGGFSVWDPARNYWRDRNPDADDAAVGLPGPGLERQRSFQFSQQEVWDGISERVGDGKREICNGLIRDVETWRLKKNRSFKLLQEILTTLSPDDVESLKLGKGMRVPPDVRDVPTLVLPYGTVPVTHAASGMKRVLALAYLIVWAWKEHELASEALKKKPTNRIVVLFDEVESHLHPKWQRRFVPALNKVIESALLKDKGASTQFICTTHAPLVLTSIETLFDEEKDTLLHINIEGEYPEVKPVPWAARGTVGYWLTSPVFGLTEARSKDAEVAIQAAKDFMVGHQDRLPEDLQDANAIHEELKRTLPGQDPFWPRWMIKTGLED